MSSLATRAKWMAVKIGISLALDYRTLRLSCLTPGEKAALIGKKYFVLFKHILGVPFRFGESKVRLWGRDLIYEQAEGIVRLQSIVARHLPLLQSECKVPIREFVDVGANIGYYTLAVRKFAPEARVTAIEPVGAALSACRQNVGTADEIVDYRPVAVGASPGRAKMRTDSKFMAECRIDEFGDLQVGVDTLDRLLAHKPRIDLLKMDIEGFESAALAGATRTLAKTRYLMLETSRGAPVSFSRLMSQLTGPGFNFELRGIVQYRASHSTHAFSVADFLLENPAVTAAELSLSGPRTRRWSVSKEPELSM